MTDWQYCKKIMKRHGKGYYFATRFFPKEIRFATYAFYAWVRKLDDIVDETENKLKAKEDFKNWITDWRKTEGGESVARPEMRAFIKVAKKWKIKKEFTESFINSMQMDLEKNSYKNMAELKEYMYGSATIIGLVMLQITESFTEEAKPYAEALGEAMQLTNFLRDVKDDYQKRGRIYIPEDELKKYELDLEDVKNQRLCRPFVKFKIDQAKVLFNKSRDGIKFLHPKARFPILLSSYIYESILDEIEKQDYNVFIKRAKTNLWKKIIITFKTYIWYRKNM